MKKEYAAPTLQVLKVRMACSLLSGSITEDTSKATEMSSGSFGSRGRGSMWDDDEEE